MKDSEGYCTGCKAETYHFLGETRCESCAGVLRQSDPRKQPVTTEPAESRPRMVADGGRVSVPVLGDVHPALLGAGVLAVIAGIRARNAGPDTVESREPEVVEESDTAFECPECGEELSPQGMQGHLRWKHDMEAEEIEEILSE